MVTAFQQNMKLQADNTSMQCKEKEFEKKIMNEPLMFDHDASPIFSKIQIEPSSFLGQTGDGKR